MIVRVSVVASENQRMSMRIDLGLEFLFQLVASEDEEVSEAKIQVNSDTSEV